jgi:hypothetical protein
MDEIEILAETDDFSIWRSEDEGGVVYHLEFGAVTVHLYQEEWDQFLNLVEQVRES